MDNQVTKDNVFLMKRGFIKLKVNVVFITALFFSNLVLAVDIAQSPLFLNKSATPNIMFVLDDSGSMDLDILTIPHHEAWLYEPDLDRSWAKGGWLNTGAWGDGTQYIGDGGINIQDKRTTGDWVSFAAQCRDRNGDGICYNENDYNADGDKDDREQAGYTKIISQRTEEHGYNSCEFYTPTTYIKHHRPRHRHYTSGYCYVPAKPPPPSNVLDAQDYLPQEEQFSSLDLNKVVKKTDRVNAEKFDFSTLLAILTGSADLAADHGANPACTNGGVSSHSDETIWHNTSSVVTAPGYVECMTTGSGRWIGGAYHIDLNVSTETEVGHDIDEHDHATHSWRNYDEVVTYTRPTYYDKLPSTTVIDESESFGALDINGNGSIYAGLDGENHFHEKDEKPYMRDSFKYLYESSDNVFRNPLGKYGDNTKPWKSCTGDGNYQSAYACGYLVNADYPTGYHFDADLFQTATSKYFKGNQKIVTLPDLVKRQRRFGGAYPWPSLSKAPPFPGEGTSFKDIPWADWAGVGPKPANYPKTVTDSLGNIHPSPAGTHHAMSRWDPWPIIVDWRIRSADFNVIYYNPDVDCNAWPGLSNASFTEVRSDPEPTSVGYSEIRDLSRPHASVSEINTATVPYRHPTEAGFVYEVWTDDAGYGGTRPRWTKFTDRNCSINGWVASSIGVTGVVDPATGGVVASGDRVCSNYSDTPNGEVDLWDAHHRVDVYTDKVVVQKVRRTPHMFGEQPYSSRPEWKMLMFDTRVSGKVIYTPENYSTYKTNADCIAILGEDPDNSGHCKTVEQVQQNAANWYQYSRRRSFVAKGAVASLLESLPDLRYGLNVTSAEAGVSNLFIEMPSNGVDYATHNEGIRDSLYSYVWKQAGTPLRGALDRVGKYFKGELASPYDDSPIIEICQKNFALMLTDGYWSGVSPLGISDEDGDGYAATLADVAKKYYDEDLHPLLANEVPVDSFDTNNQQHLTTIGIGFGVTGSLTDPDGDGWPGTADASGALSYTESSDWGNPVGNSQNKINDLWHAAYNSRGLYLNAKNPTELIEKLNAAILFATAVEGSGSAVSVNSNALSPRTRLFQTTFNSGDWSGDVRSFPLNQMTASLLSSEWSAKTKLKNRDSADRKIFTMNTAGDTVPFLLPSLDAEQVNELRKAWPKTTYTIDSASTEYAQAQLDYIRGEDSAQFRDRTGNKLGDIVHSEATFVAEPKSPYFSLEGDYAEFRKDYIHRIPTVYVGANDGMLHAFDASTDADKGNELFAYIPKMLIPRLNSLTHKNTATQPFVHKYFVDATPTVGDAYFDNAWHTTLVGGLGAGGKGVYALDITNAPANQAPIALWEFSDSNSADMGYSFSKPIVVKLNKGESVWGAIFGNGYDSTTGKAVLYVINIKTGAIIAEIDTGVGDTDTPNGLSSPTVLDTDGDLIADKVYAGDLLGNVWSFDISASNSNSWSATKIFTANTAQPITQKIAVQEHPLGALAGYLLHFGTGQFFRLNDNDADGQDTQSIYAIWDCSDGECSGLSSSDLLEQVVEAEVGHATAAADLRVTSSNEIAWLDDPEVQVGDSGWQSHIDDHGWYLNLLNPGDSVVAPPVPAGNYGERVVSKAVLYGRSVLYSTLLPATDACDGGGSGWLMSLNSSNGARHEEASFDVTGNGTFTSDDYADWTESGGSSRSTTASGVRSTTGIPSLPVIISGPNGSGISIADRSTAKIGISSSVNTGESNCTAGICGASSGTSGGEGLGRQSWIQLD
ncbi:MAG: PilC/PilY family type IV pilus protein [Gammaproteobacteria bacterium]|nr:PilC/PilY family type IV pilus protein [Gammaproteobacteria bacterium]